MTNAAEKFVAESGIDYTAEFVPHSKSRNADTDRCLNWRVTLSKNGHNLTTDYMQGIGHIPGYPSMLRMTLDVDAAVSKACETGQYAPWLGNKSPSRFGYLKKPLPAPTLTDVLYCLVLDAEAIEHPTFEDWAAEFDYDTDSRKAESTYRTCLETALKLRHIVDLDAAREAFQDY